MRKLASIKQIRKIEPIEGKDRIVLAHIDGWQAIVKKDEFQVGNLVIFCEPDSVLPQKPEFEFLAKTNYRIKTMRMGGVLSQGLILPTTLLPKNIYYQLDEDVTKILGITQYEKTIDKEQPTAQPKHKYPKWLMRWKWFRNLVIPNMYEDFPSFLTKTDETRIQNIPEILKSDTNWVVTEKVDGTSGTFALRKINKWYGTKYEFYVCSRNRRILKDDGSIYWEVAKRYELEKFLKEAIQWGRYKNSEWVCIQGECISPKIQGNKYKVKDTYFYVFNLISEKYGREDSIFANKIIRKFSLCEFVPIIIECCYLQTHDAIDMLALSNGKSMINPNVMREGFVVRSVDGKKSFKVVSPEFLIKHDE